MTAVLEPVVSIAPAPVVGDEAAGATSSPLLVSLVEAVQNASNSVC